MGLTPAHLTSLLIEYGPVPFVCGSDKRLYKSICHLNRESCLRQVEILLIPVMDCHGGEAANFLLDC